MVRWDVSAQLWSVKHQGHYQRLNNTTDAAYLVVQWGVSAWLWSVRRPGSQSRIPLCRESPQGTSGQEWWKWAVHTNTIIRQHASAQRNVTAIHYNKSRNYGQVNEVTMLLSRFVPWYPVLKQTKIHKHVPINSCCLMHRFTGIYFFFKLCLMHKFRHILKNSCCLMYSQPWRSHQGET